MKGLMFSKLHEREGLLFVFPHERNVDIHMLFVFFPLDILWLDGKGRVVSLVRKAKPFTLFVKGKRAGYLLEVRGGVADRLRVGDNLTIKLKREKTSL